MVQVLNTSRFFAGKNKVMKIALGTSAETETHNNLHLLSEVLLQDVTTHV